MKKESPKNILSYTKNQTFTGREIKNWINYHIQNSTSKTKIALKLKKHLQDIDDNEKYFLIKKEKEIEIKQVNNYYIFVS